MPKNSNQKLTLNCVGFFYIYLSEVEKSRKFKILMVKETPRTN